MRSATLPFVLITLLGVSLAAADDGLDCLRKLKGGTVTWDMDWQRDRKDHDVPYRIVNITEGKANPNQTEIALELVAMKTAALERRVSRIRMDHAAELFCMRARAVQLEPVRPVTGPLPKAPDVVLAKQFSGRELPYRVYQAGRWLPARMPKNGDVRVCVTKSAVFSCSDKDYFVMKRDGRMQSLMGRGNLPHPFIRFRDGGWVRGSTADLPELGHVSSCTVFGRKFSCLESERMAYSQQLKMLEARADR
jgi:hypothetical protein